MNLSENDSKYFVIKIVKFFLLIQLIWDRLFCKDLDIANSNFEYIN